MNDFDYDVYQKKVIARGAFYRKCGAKSKRCTLPSDNLTRKELCALNGELKTYNIHRRMTWEQFKDIPDDIAAAHIKYLVDTFGVNLNAIAEALGVSHVTVSRYLKEHGIQMERRRFIPSKEWREFIGVPAPEVVEDAPRSSAPVEVHEEPIPFLRGSLVLTGTKGRVLQRLYEVLPDNVTVTVEFTTEADCQ